MSDINDYTNQIHTGDATETLSELPDSSVHMMMTSPPYFGLRDYGVDGQIGLEDSLDEYIAELVDVFREVRRVLRPDGSAWLNLGDSYAGDKSKMLVPHRVAIALQDDGWIVRNDVTWVKPNAVPSSVKDRLNTTTEQVFHLTPEPDYWYDLDAIREPHSENSIERRERHDTTRGGEDTYGQPEHTGFEGDDLHAAGKNPGDVFEVTTKPFPEAHFAVYPPELVETPLKATCPPRVCAACGAPYERNTEEVPIWEQGPETVTRAQTRRALELADEHGLTESHFEAARTVGIGNLDASEGNPYERVDDETADLARETADALGSYYREALLTETRPGDDWRATCDCDTDATEPGIALDPFAGAGTTCLVAKEHGRRFVGIDLNAEYVAMAQQRLGLTVENPEHVRDDAEAGLGAFTDGGAE